MHVRFYAMAALVFNAMLLYVYVIYQICFVRNSEINKLPLLLLAIIHTCVNFSFTIPALYAQSDNKFKD